MKKNEEMVNGVEGVESVMSEVEVNKEVELLKEIERLKKELEESKKGKGIGRKGEVLNLLKEGRISIKDMAKKIGISERNVSSQLSYLRDDGILIGTDSKGRKYLEVE